MNIDSDKELRERLSRIERFAEIVKKAAQDITWGCPRAPPGPPRKSPPGTPPPCPSPRKPSLSNRNSVELVAMEKETEIKPSIVSTVVQDRCQSAPCSADILSGVAAAAIETVSTLVWPLLKQFITNPSQLRQQWRMKIPGKNPELRKILFEREKKAQKKYGRGLSLFEDKPGIKEAQEKLADSCFLLFKYKEEQQQKEKAAKTNKEDKQLIRDLICVIESILFEIKE